MGLIESASAQLGATPETVFKTLTDVARLPEWNAVITEVVENPGQLTPGTEWKVKVHALGSTWVSKSRVAVLDESTGHFRYRSQTDDGNPSYADWEWQVESADGGSTVKVTADINPQTFWRKHLLAKLRRRALRKELRASLLALGSAANRSG